MHIKFYIQKRSSVYESVLTIHSSIPKHLRKPIETWDFDPHVIIFYFCVLKDIFIVSAFRIKFEAEGNNFNLLQVQQNFLVFFIENSKSGHSAKSDALQDKNRKLGLREFNCTKIRIPEIKINLYQI